MTIRLSTSMIYQNGLKTMMETQNEIQRSQTQITTGKRMQSASDDPAAASAILQLNDTKQRTEQYQLNAQAATAKLSFQESVYSDITHVMNRVRELVIQGNNDSTTRDDRQIIAEEISILRDELITTANGKDINGDYIYSGNLADTEPFTDAGGVVTYHGDEGIRELKIGASRNIAVNEDGKSVFMKIPNGNGVFSVTPATTNTGSGVISLGSEVTSFVEDTYDIQFTAADPELEIPASYEIFDSLGVSIAGPTDFQPGDTIAFAGIEFSIDGDPATGDSFVIEPSANQDIFATLQGLVDIFNTAADNNLGTVNRQNAIINSLAGIDNAMEGFEALRTLTGSRLNSIERQVEVNDNLIHQDTVNISRLEDTDMVDAIMNFQMQLQALQASQKSFSSMQQQSLFDFI